jgi:hypothetical protein
MTARVLVLAVACSAVALPAPRLFFSKYFKGSVPEYVAITVESDGQVTFQTAMDDPDPIKFQLGAARTQQMFDLAVKLDHFQRPIESGLKIANLGAKTFRFEDGSEKHQVEFNYSEDANAQALLDLFEQITETEQHFIDLDRTVHFDKLGVNDVLLQLGVTWDHKRLVAPEQFLPLLDRIAKNESFLHLARERAAGMAEAIRKPPTPSPEKTQ